MAVAEARAVWQRTANRCFVQEDAKRAPKLACCQSSVPSKQVEAGPTATPDGQDQPTVGFIPLSRKPSSSNLSPDSRWWLQMQPNHGYQKGFTYEQINSLEKNEGKAESGVVKSTTRISEAQKRKGDVSDHFYSVKKKASEMEKNMEELVEIKDLTDSADCINYKKLNDTCFESEYSFLGSEKSEPWWWMSDKEELVSLVARKSLDRVENCDLPPPQKLCHKNPLYFRVGNSDNKDVFLSSFTSSLSSSTPVSSQGFGESGKSQKKHVPDETLRYSSTHECTPEIQPGCKAEEYSKVQLMEALCHSQTRAREAEKAAKRACDEKEHTVTLFFRQASLLFAYKQWFHLLQLETYFARFNNNFRHASHKRPRAGLHKGNFRGESGNDMAKYAVAFALGLSLVGAGLVLGWTVGWMLPHF